MEIKHNFGEKEIEKIQNEKKEWVEVPVWQSPKFKESRDKAIEMIDSKKYGLCDGDFWILMNKTKNDKMAYTGLIISHNGCLKINDNLDNKVNPKAFTLDKEGYANSLVYTYCDEDTFEVGEFNQSNGKNAYPYAMAFKRCFDRVVLKKSKLAYSGIYSEVEAEEFKKNQTEELAEKINRLDEIMELEIDLGLDHEKILTKMGVKSNMELTQEQQEDILKTLRKMKEDK